MARSSFAVKKFTGSEIIGERMVFAVLGHEISPKCMMDTCDMMLSKKGTLSIHLRRL